MTSHNPTAPFAGSSAVLGSAKISGVGMRLAVFLVVLAVATLTEVSITNATERRQARIVPFGHGRIGVKRSCRDTGVHWFRAPTRIAFFLVSHCLLCVRWFLSKR